MPSESATRLFGNPSKLFNVCSVLFFGNLFYNINDFRYHLYPVPEHCRNDSLEWYDHLPGDVISHPYDPLLVMLAIEDAQAQVAYCPRPEESLRLFQRQPVGEAHRGHECVGNSDEDEDEDSVTDTCGVRSAAAVRQALLARMLVGADAAC